jgi:hypothetical protein
MTTVVEAGRPSGIPAVTETLWSDDGPFVVPAGGLASHTLLGLPPVNLQGATRVSVPAEAVDHGLAHELLLLLFVVAVAMGAGAVVTATGIIVTV